MVTHVYVKLRVNVSYTQLGVLKVVQLHVADKPSRATTGKTIKTTLELVTSENTQILQFKV